MDDNILSRLQRIRERYDELTNDMGRPEVAADFEQLNKLARERSETEKGGELFRGSGANCGRGTRGIPATSSSRFARAPAAKRPPCSPSSSTALMPATPNGSA